MAVESPGPCCGEPRPSEQTSIPPSPPQQAMGAWRTPETHTDGVRAGSLEEVLSELTAEEEWELEKEHSRQKEQHRFALRGKNRTSREG